MVFKLYKNFFDCANVPFCIIGFDNSFHLVNPVFQGLIGYSETQLHDKKFLSFVYPDDLSKTEKAFRALPDKRTHELEIRFICSNGSPRLFSWNFFVSKQEGLIYAIGKDITDQRETEKTLVDELRNKKKTAFTDLTNEFRVLLDAIPDNIMLLSPDMKILWANKATGEKFSTNVNELTGQFCYKLCCNIHAPCEHCPSLKTYMSGNDEESIVNTEDGKVWDIKSFPVKNESGEITNIIELAKDVTMKASLESEIDRTAQYLMSGKFGDLSTHPEQNDFVSSIKNILKMIDLSTGPSSGKYGSMPDHGKAFSNIITQNKKMHGIFSYIEAIAATMRPVMIAGETGVGKELIAEAIHERSGLKGKFIPVNVAGLDDTMFSDTLFGHKKGAFTGADKDRKGLILQASGGTLLLDEFGDLNEPSQIKLLRLLEDNSYYALGSDHPEKSNVRIIVTTNRDLKKLISQKKFREDLYYRLSSYFIQVPPLRERLDDIPLLLDYFLEEAVSHFHKKKPSYPKELIILLTNYEFPGNVRELKAMIYDAIALHKSGKLSMNIFKSFISQKSTLAQNNALQTAENASDTASPFISKKLPTLKEAETYLIDEAMKKAKGNQGIAASLLGITRHALNKKLKKHKPTH